MFRILYNVTHASIFRMQPVRRCMQNWRWTQSVYGSVKLLGIRIRLRKLFTKYVLGMQSEHSSISKKWYIKYQLRVSATILAIIMLYSTYQVAVQCMCNDICQCNLSINLLKPELFF